MSSECHSNAGNHAQDTVNGRGLRDSGKTNNGAYHLVLEKITQENAPSLQLP